MQTKQQIQKLLSSAGVTPNHRLGQNFLIDLNLMRLLVDSAGIHSNDIVLEVGCGTGSLTEALAEQAGCVIAVEFDSTLADITKNLLREKHNVKVLQTDVLESKNTIDHTVKETLKTIRKKYLGRVMLVANLPYSVACPVMINLLTSTPFADCMYVTVQKEVADRMKAAPSSRHYGPLSILLSAFGEVKMMRVLKPTVFWPQPKVDSAMVSFVRSQEKVKLIHSTEIFTEVVSLFMQHRRKMLKACTKFAEGKLENIHNWPEIFDDSCVDPHWRPERLAAQNYIAIANLCSEYISSE